MKKVSLILLTLALMIGAVTLSVSAADGARVDAGKQVKAAADAMVFPTDGATCEEVCPVCGTYVTWSPLYTADVSSGISLANNGHYYLAEDIEAAGVNITVRASLSHYSCLHLNNKKLINTSSNVLTGTSGNLNIMGQGIVKGGRTGENRGATVEISAGGSYGNISLYGGTYGKVTPSDTANVIAIRNNGGIINMYEGARVETGTKGSAVYIQSEMAYVNATFNMYGGTVDATNATERAIDTEEVSDRSAGKLTFNMYGGTIQGGTGAGNVLLRKNTTMNLYGGTIRGGKASSGGSIYLYSFATMNMYGGTVTGGTSTGKGGNIFMDYGANLNMYGGTVSDGTAGGEGGNIQASGDGTKGLCNLYFRDATVSGGNATDAGGNISALRSNLTIEGDTKILNGTSAVRAGNLRVYQSMMIMRDGLIAGGTSNYSGAKPHDVWVSASSTRKGHFYMLGGTIDSKDNATGSAITMGGSSYLYLANDATIVDHASGNDDVYVTGKAYICDGWSGVAGVRIGGYLTSGKTISSTYGEVVTLQDDLTVTAGGSFTGKLMQGGCGVDQNLKLGGFLLVDQKGLKTYTNAPLADFRTGEYAYVQLYGDAKLEDLSGETLWVDLNGYDLTADNGMVYAFDSANDGYDATKCGTVSGTAELVQDVAAPNGNRYLAVTENGATTMHRLSMQVTSVSLRTSEAGVYYKASYRCDQVLASKVTGYGVVLSLNNMPGADFATETGDINRYTVGGDPFTGDLETTSGSVFGILKDSRSAANNSKYGQMKIYANPYITLGEQTFVGDNENAGKTADAADFDGTALSLRDTMESVDDLYFRYAAADRDTMNRFYADWQEKGMTWKLVNINGQQTFDNSDLRFEEGTNDAYCPVCEKTVTWTPVTQAAHGTAGLGAPNVTGTHYYLTEDILYTGTADYFYRASGSGRSNCFHLNGHDLTATGCRVFMGYAGVLNIMGNGTVCGNNQEENKGATIHINTSGKNGRVNLYGGTYTKLASNRDAAVLAVGGGGGIQLFEDATVKEPALGCSVYVGNGSSTDVHLGIHGAKIEGEVRQIAPKTSAVNTSLSISGRAEIDEVNIGSMYVKTTISGAPKIGRLAGVFGSTWTLKDLTPDTEITVSIRGPFTAASENMAEYANYFRPYISTDTLTVTEDNKLSYNINYELYMTPYVRDVCAEAIADGKIHYYFMAGEGMIMSPTTTGELDKWGDSCLIVFPNGETMLVDTGYAVQQPVIIGNLKRMGIGSEENPLDYLLITHPHSDHIGAFSGSSAFLDEIKVGQVYHNRLVATGDVETYWIENACAARNLPVQNLERGDVLSFGDVKMEVLWPVAGTSETTIKLGEINDQSMVFRLDYGEHSSLFTGDLYEKGEGDLMAIEEPEKMDVDFLKIPHHGWNTSSLADFVNAITPELAVATGRVEMVNKIYQRYVAVGAQVLMDLAHGYIHVSAGSDGTMDYETSR